MENVDRWNQVGAEEIPTTEFDKKVAEWRKQCAVVEEKKEAEKAAREVADQLENELLDMLKRAKKTKYQAEGFGTASIKNTYMVRTPKGIGEKKALFDWIKEKHGPDALMGLVGINSATLNAFVNTEKTNDPLVEIPGLEAPTHRESIAFRSEKK